ncbi:MAG: hypothetical protein HY875_00175 [Chloroflexi bacterium]|nr:hypothetical protein [Chloroflexota bacterium]
MALFAVRLVSRQPTEIPADQWQAIVADQLRAVRANYDQGKLRAIYREAGTGVLAIYDVSDARELDTVLAQLPMWRYFHEVEVRALWDMVPALPSA